MQGLAQELLLPLRRQWHACQLHAAEQSAFNARLKAAGKPDMVITNGEFFVKRAN
jgi:hypothetical protein